MKVTKTRHLGYLTRMSEAKNDEERKTIFALKWPKAVSMLATEANFFAEMVEECRKYETWKLLRAGYKSFEEFCEAKLSMTLDEVTGLVAYVNEAGGKKVTYQDWKNQQTDVATRAGPLQDKSGAPTGSSNNPSGVKKDEEPNVDNVSIRSVGGNSLSYTVRRLLRDHPELHAKVVDGEMSANAAAIEAGFRKKPTPYQIVKREWPKLTTKEKAEFNA